MPGRYPFLLLCAVALTAQAALAGQSAATGAPVANPAPAAAAPPCVDFKWDVARERRLFAGSPTPLAAGRDSAAAPPLAFDRLYELKLLPQNRVAFAAPPGKSTYGENVYAGLATVTIPAPGTYRIAVDLPLWIDLAIDNQLIRAADYEGQNACDPPHKILVYELTQPGRFVLQLSGEIAQRVRVTLTRVRSGAAP